MTIQNPLLKAPSIFPNGAGIIDSAVYKIAAFEHT